MSSHKKKNILIPIIIIFLVISVSLIYLQIYNSKTIIDIHEHIESLEKAELLIQANQSLSIHKTILVPSPIETLRLNGKKSFTEYRKNIDELSKISKKYPKQFSYYCTINPLDSDAPEYIKKCIEDGGVGIKLYNGHSYYYPIFGIPLDSEKMLPIYAFAEKNHIPLLFHINITKYQNEIENVLKKYPKLVVDIPHYMVSSIHIEKVEDLFDRYPNLYTDISFGSPEFMASGFRRISKNPGKYVDFINKYQDHILFGSDMVLTNVNYKNKDYMQEILSCYKNLLEKRRFTCAPVENYYENMLSKSKESYDNCKPKEGRYCKAMKEKMIKNKKRYDETIKLNGLGLDENILNKLYRKNAEHFLKANQ